MPVEQRMVTQAYKFALDPTPAQARAFSSHVGGARFAFNFGIAAVAAARQEWGAQKEAGVDKPDVKIPGHFDLCALWNAHKRTAEWVDRDTGDVTEGIPWVGRNSSSIYLWALKNADGAWKRYQKSARGGIKGRKVGRPRFKAKSRARESFTLHGTDTQVVDAHHLKVPAATGGTVKTHESTRKLLRRLQHGQATCTQCQGAGHIRRAKKTARSQRKLYHGRPQWMSDRFKRCTGCRGTGKTGPAETRLVGCPTCIATGQVPATEKCPACSGEGHAATGSMAVVRGCVDCRGTGERAKLDSAPVSCGDCKGEAKVPPARIANTTISRDSDGRWYASLVVYVVRQVRTGPSERQRNGGTVGIDLGVRSLVVTSDGETVDHPRHLSKALAKLSAAQRTASRREKGSARRGKANRYVARLHARVKRLRQDATEKLTSQLVHSHERIGIEGWDVQQTAQHGSADVPKKVRRDRNRVLADANLGELRTQLKNKAAWYGTTVLVSGKHAATGRTCSACGRERANPVPPAHDMFSCPGCGWVGDRRVNTARVLAGAAREQHSDASSAGESLNARGAGVSPGGLRVAGRSASKREARSRPPGRGESGSPGP